MTTVAKPQIYRLENSQMSTVAYVLAADNTDAVAHYVASPAWRAMRTTQPPITTATPMETIYHRAAFEVYALAIERREGDQPWVVAMIELNTTSYAPPLAEPQPLWPGVLPDEDGMGLVSGLLIEVRQRVEYYRQQAYAWDKMANQLARIENLLDTGYQPNRGTS